LVDEAFGFVNELEQVVGVNVVAGEQDVGILVQIILLYR
jgi:hypothetical protein